MPPFIALVVGRRTDRSCGSGPMAHRAPRFLLPPGWQFRPGPMPSCRPRALAQTGRERSRSSVAAFYLCRRADRSQGSRAVRRGAASVSGFKPRARAKSAGGVTSGSAPSHERALCVCNALHELRVPIARMGNSRPPTNELDGTRPCLENRSADRDYRGRTNPPPRPLRKAGVDLSRLPRLRAVFHSAPRAGPTQFRLCDIMKLPRAVHRRRKIRFLPQFGTPHRSRHKLCAECAGRRISRRGARRDPNLDRVMSASIRSETARPWPRPIGWRRCCAEVVNLRVRPCPWHL